MGDTPSDETGGSAGAGGAAELVTGLVDLTSLSLSDVRRVDSPVLAVCLERVLGEAASAADAVAGHQTSI